MRRGILLPLVNLACVGLALAQVAGRVRSVEAILSEAVPLGPDDGGAIHDVAHSAPAGVLRSLSGELIANLLGDDRVRARNAAMLFTEVVRRPEGRDIFSPYVGKLLESLKTPNFAAHGWALWA